MNIVFQALNRYLYHQLDMEAKVMIECAWASHIVLSPTYSFKVISRHYFGTSSTQPIALEAGIYPIK